MAKIDIARMKVGVDFDVNKNSIDPILKTLQQISLLSKASGNSLNEGLKEAGKTAEKVSGILEKSFSKSTGTLDIAKFSNELSKAGLSVSQLKDSLEKGGASGSMAFNQISNEILGMNIKLKQSSVFLDKMAITLSNTIRFAFSSSVVNNFTGKISEAYEYVQKLDKSLNDIRIVSGQSAKEMEKFAKKANESAKDLGATTLDYTKASLIYYQQGLPEDQIKERTDITIKMANVLGSKAEEVSDYMTAIWNNFADPGDNLERYADIITKLGAATASSAEEIAGGLEKFAAVGKTIGLSYEYATSALTTITAKTRQSEDVVGTALKTIFSRIQGLSLGETLEDNTDLNKYSAALKAVGIDIKDTNGELKDMDVILEEMGAKWQLLSRDQQVALAQTVAGVRQYNQLVALMDNWDFMEDNLKVANEAVGELNNQQDIYLDSMEAHMNKLESSWQKLYGTILDPDELKGGVDVITNIIEGMNNMAESFGGGTKSLTGFAAMFSSLFTGPIDQALTRFITNSNLAKQNAQAFKMKSDFISVGSSVAENETVEQKATREANETQLANAQRLQGVYKQLGEEDTQRVIELQKQAVELERQANLMEALATQESDKAINTLLDKDIITDEDSIKINEAENAEAMNAILEEVEERYAKIVNVAKATDEILADQVKKLHNSEEYYYEIEDLIESINLATKGTATNTKKELAEMAKKIKNGKISVEDKNKILSLSKKIVEETKEEEGLVKKASAAVEEQRKAEEKVAELRERSQDKNKDIDNLLKPAEQAQNMVSAVNTLISAGSSLATVWGTVTSLFSTWGSVLDGDVNIGDAVVQTVVALSMALPALSAAYGAFSTVIAASNAAKAKAIVLDTAVQAASTAIVAKKGAEVAIEEALVAAKAQGVAVSKEEVLAHLAESGVLGAEATAKIGNAAATNTLTAAQTALNASMWANPITWILAAAVGAVAVIALVTSHINKANKAIKENNEATVEASNKTIEQTNNINKLCASYERLYNDYKNGRASTEELEKATSELADSSEILTGKVRKEDIEVANLTKDYEELNKKIKETQKTALKEGKIAAVNKKESSGQLLLDDAREDLGYKDDSRYKINFGDMAGSIFNTSDEDKISNAVVRYADASILRNYKKNDDGSVTWAGFDVEANAEGIEQLYDTFGEIINAVNDESNGYYMSKNERDESEVYQEMVAWRRKVEKQVQEYKAAKEEIAKYEAELDVADMDFNSVNSVADMEKQRDILAAKLQTIEGNKDKSPEELESLANSYIAGTSEKAKELINQLELIDKATDNLKNKDHASEYESALKNLPEEQRLAFAANKDLINQIDYDKLAQDGLTLEEALSKVAVQYLKTTGSVVTYTEAEKKLIETYGVDQKELEAYIGLLAQKNPKLAENATNIKKVAQANMRLKVGIDDLADDWDKYNKIMSNSKAKMQDVAAIAPKVNKAVQNMLDMDDETFKLLPDDFAKKNWKLIQDVVDGVEGSVDKLRDVAGQEILLNISPEVDLDKDGKLDAEIQKLHEKIAAFNNEKFDIGIAINPEQYAAFYKSCQEMINAAAMTQQEATKYFGAMGYDVEFDSNPQKKKEDVVDYQYDYTYNALGEPTYRKVTPIHRIVESTIDFPAIKTITPNGHYGGNVAVNTKGGTSSGHPKGGSKGGGSSSKKEKNKSDEKFDRYQEVNKKLEMTSTLLSRLQDQEDKLLGKDLISNLNQQLNKLNSEIDLTKQKLKIAQGEQNEYANKLKNYGIKFNADGSINQQSYVNAFNAEQNRYNNAYTDDEAAKKRWENFKEFISNYNDLISTIDDLKDDIQKDLDKQLEINIRKFTLELEVRLNIKEASIKFNEFKRKIIDELSDDDIAGAVQQAFDNIKSVYSSKVIEELIEKINKEISEIGNPKIYGDNATKLLENLQEHYETLMDILIELDDYEQEIIDGYVDMLDHVSEEMDDQLSTYEQISSIIEHDMKLIQLTQGENAYDELKSYYERQTKVLNDSIDMRRRDMEFFAQQMATLEEAGRKDTEAWKNAEEAWKQATLDWQSAIEDAIEKLQEKLLNAINATFEKINEELTKNKGLEYLDQEWELINKNADKYLDSLNAAYSVQQLQNKYLDAINDNDSVLQQQKLQGLMNDELKALREKDKLSQYDLDRADLRYQIALKQIALEDAQQNKSKMRLRRDSQGNYSYQYTADDDQIAKTQQEISDLYNQLYNLDKNKYSDSLREIYDVWNEYQEKMAEAAQINDPEKRAERELLIQEQYGELLNNLAAENEELKFNLQESTFSELFDLYSINQDNYESMTNNQQIMLDAFFNDETDLQGAAYNNLFNLYDENVDRFRTMTEEERNILIGEMVPAWNSGIQEMVDTIVNDEGGFVPVMDRAFEEIKQATNDYKVDLDNLAESAGINFETIKDGIDSNIEATEKLLGDNKDLLDSYDKEVEAIGKVWDALDKLKLQYKQLAEEAKKAAEEGYKALNIKNEKTANEYAKDEVNSEKPTPTPTPAVTPVAPAPASRPATPSAPSLTQGSYVKVKSGVRWYADSYGGGSSGPARNGSIRYINTRGSHPYNIDGLGWVRKTDIQGYRTGGYTGDWSGQDGRLAFLHQKELILNENDTKNMLAAISILRDFNNDMLNRLSATGLGGLTGSKLEQNVHIDATFPNVTSANEIENALNNLVNVASQRINR